MPGLDNPAAFSQTGAVPVTDMARSFDRKQPIVLIDAKTGKRQLIWSELDSLASSPDQTDLIIRPGQNLKEGHRYIVALRNLKYAGGNTIPAPQGFRLYRDRIHTKVPLIEQRRPALRAHLRDAETARGSRGTTFTWRGTSPSPASETSPSACFRSETTRSRSWATTTSPMGRCRARRPPSQVTDVSRT